MRSRPTSFFCAKEILIFLSLVLLVLQSYAQPCGNLEVDAGPDIDICIGSSTSIGGSPTADWSGGGSPSFDYAWTPAGSVSDPTIANPTVSPTTTTTYTVVVSTSSCIDSATVTVTVLPLPNVTLDPFSDVCSEASSFSLNGGSPSGGTYSGPGVSGGNFDAGSANIGNNTITYTYLR